MTEFEFKFEIRWDIGSKRWEWDITEFGTVVNAGVASTKAEAQLAVRARLIKLGAL